jgi:phage terminase small subunit
MFVELYLSGKTAKGAYTGAGYKARAHRAEYAAERLLRNVEVIRVIDEARRVPVVKEW